MNLTFEKIHQFAYNITRHFIVNKKILTLKSDALEGKIAIEWHHSRGLGVGQVSTVESKLVGIVEGHHVPDNRDAVVGESELDVQIAVISVQNRRSRVGAVVFKNDLKYETMYI